MCISTIRNTKTSRNFNIKFIYTLAPSTTVLSKNTTLGSLITTILWIISSAIFGYYLEYFAKYYTKIEGSGNAEIAKWSFRANNTSTVMEKIQLML